MATIERIFEHSKAPSALGRGFARRGGARRDKSTIRRV